MFCKKINDKLIIQQTKNNGLNILSFDFEAEQKFKVIKENIFKNQKVLQIEVNEEHIVALTDKNKVYYI